MVLFNTNKTIFQLFVMILVIQTMQETIKGTGPGVKSHISIFVSKTIYLGEF
jgi:hypothetical protein